MTENLIHVKHQDSLHAMSMGAVLCHGWASGLTAWLSRHILGVEVLDVGCRRLRVTPHLGDLQWAEGTFPTPLGPVSIRYERDASGKVSIRIDAPDGITVIR